MIVVRGVLLFFAIIAAVIGMPHTEALRGSFWSALMFGVLVVAYVATGEKWR